MGHDETDSIHLSWRHSAVIDQGSFSLLLGVQLKVLLCRIRNAEHLDLVIGQIEYLKGEWPAVSCIGKVVSAPRPGLCLGNTNGQ